MSFDPWSEFLVNVHEFPEKIQFPLVLASKASREEPNGITQAVIDSEKFLQCLIDHGIIEERQR